MSDYVVQIKVKNAPMLRAMRARGFATAAELSKACGVHQGRLGEYLNLKRSPMLQDGMWRDDFMRIAEVLRAMPADLFPLQHLKAPLRKNTAETEISLSELAGPDVAAAWLASPEDELINDDVRRKLKDAMDALPDRYRYVLECRFGINGPEKTLDEVGADLSVGRERVRQMEARALRKIKHPAQSSQIIDAGYNRPLPSRRPGSRGQVR